MIAVEKAKVSISAMFIQYLAAQNFGIFTSHPKKLNIFNWFNNRQDIRNIDFFLKSLDIQH